MDEDPTADSAYLIRVQGHLSRRWASWFDGLELTRHEDGTTTLRGQVPDQAALHGVLSKVRDMGVTLLSVTRDSAAHQQEHPTP